MQTNLGYGKSDKLFWVPNYNRYRTGIYFFISPTRFRLPILIQNRLSGENLSRSRQRLKINGGSPHQWNYVTGSSTSVGQEESGSFIQLSQKSKETTLPERVITIIGDEENNRVSHQSSSFIPVLRSRNNFFDSGSTFFTYFGLVAQWRVFFILTSSKLTAVNIY